ARLFGSRLQTVVVYVDYYVAIVGADHVAGVGERLELGLLVLDHARVRVPGRGHGDAGAEVDELVAVGVLEDAAAARDHIGVQGRTNTGGHCGLATDPELTGVR